MADRFKPNAEPPLPGPTHRNKNGIIFAIRLDLPFISPALRLALELGADEEALGIIEASKAQTLLALTRQPAPGWQEAAHHDVYVRQLVEQEQALRQELTTMRQALTLQEPGEPGPVPSASLEPALRGEEEPRRAQRDKLANLARLVEDYEEILERLRVAAPRVVEAHRPSAFSLSTLRETMARHFSGRWAAVAYYILSSPSDETLVVVYIDDRHLILRPHQLNAYDRLALRQCTASESDFRELIYRGTLRGHAASHRAGSTHL